MVIEFHIQVHRREWLTVSHLYARSLPIAYRFDTIAITVGLLLAINK